MLKTQLRFLFQIDSLLVPGRVNLLRQGSQCTVHQDFKSPFTQKNQTRTCVERGTGHSWEAQRSDAGRKPAARFTSVLFGWI